MYHNNTLLLTIVSPDTIPKFKFQTQVVDFITPYAGACLDPWMPLHNRVILGFSDTRYMAAHRFGAHGMLAIECWSVDYAGDTTGSLLIQMHIYIYIPTHTIHKIHKMQFLFNQSWSLKYMLQLWFV